jgi:non-specific protein-tyrosine kinase
MTMGDDQAAGTRHGGEPPADLGGGRPRYASFADYARVARRHRWLILAITVAFVAVTVAITANQDKRYQAEAQLAFRDLFSDLNLIGTSDALPELAPGQLAQINAELITGPDVQRLAARRLGDDFQAVSVSARVGVQTNLVIVQASAPEAELAARGANEYARASRAVGLAEQRRRLRLAERAIEREIKSVRRDDSSPPQVSDVRLSVLEQTLSRIQTLAQIAEPVRIVEAAAVPGAPVSPTLARNAVVAGLVGLVFGLLAAFARDSLDRRLHTARDLHDELDAPVLTRVPASALGKSGLVADGPAPMSEADFEAFRVLRVNLAALTPDSGPRSVLVTSGVPDEGKSTVSIALACAATAAGQRTLLVECDLRRPSFTERMGIPRSPGLSDYLLGNATPQEILRTAPLALPSSVNGDGPAAAGSAGTLVCIPGGSPVANPAELLIGERFAAFIAKVKRNYDLVVLDAGPLLAIVDPLELVEQVDAVLLCVRALSTTRDEVRAARTALSHLPTRPIGAVLTGLKRRGPDSYHSYYGR